MFAHPYYFLNNQKGELTMFRNKTIDKLGEKIIRIIYVITTELSDRLGELLFVLLSFTLLTILSPFILAYINITQNIN